VRKEFWIRLGFVGTGLAVSFCLAEILLRFVSPSKLSGSFVEPDPVLGYHFQENAKSNIFYGGHWVPVRINGQGLRQDDEITREKSKGEYRVALLGDSYVFGWGVPVEENLISQLQKKVAEDFPQEKITLLNMGHGGWGTQQELAYLEKFGFKLQPDLVVLFFGPNDVEDNETVPLFRFTSKDNISSHPQPPVHLRSRPFLARFIPGYDWLLFHSYVVQLLRAPVRSYFDTLRANPEKLPTTSGVGEALSVALAERIQQEALAKNAAFFATDFGLGTPRTLSFLRHSAATFAKKSIDFLDISDAIEKARSTSSDKKFLQPNVYLSRTGYRRVVELIWPVLRGRLAAMIKRAEHSEIARSQPSKRP
jgi:lysophospholipase L1-like esterase